MNINVSVHGYAEDKTIPTIRLHFIDVINSKPFFFIFQKVETRIEGDTRRNSQEPFHSWQDVAFKQSTWEHLKLSWNLSYQFIKVYIHIEPENC